MDKSLSLYIHVPFCDGKCNYCDFYSEKITDEKADDYMKSLNKQLKSYGDIYKSREISTVYFGGGTPSVLGTERLLNILGTISDSFSLSESCEITLEVNPMSGKFLDFAVLKSGGVNRVSMGLQSAVDEELVMLGRRHRIKDVINTIECVKNSGIDNISLDVMMGIPLQTKDSLKTTLDFCINSKVEHISTYMLSIEPDTYFGKHRDKFNFADDDTQAEYFMFASDYLKNCGYEHYEISNFCKNGKYSRHNMRYWELNEYLGLGPSAHSLVNGKRFYFPRDIETFKEGKTIEDGDGNNKEEYILLMLRTNRGISIKDYEDKYNEALSADFMKKASFYEKYGYMQISDNRICLTEKGFLLSNTIIADLI